MIKKFIVAIFSFALILFSGMVAVSAQTASVSFFPAQVIQGDPLLVQINGYAISSIKNLTFDGKEISVFLYQNKPTALVGIDLNKKPGAYELVAELSDGTSIKNVVNVGERTKVEEPLGIPQKLGGNTKKSQDKLISTLIAETKIMANIPTENKALWTDKFIPPLKDISVTDPYGYSRQTGPYSIPHKGVDYRAPQGTEVMAVNQGIVRITSAYRNYGNTVVIDHGLGLMTFYLHLSKIKVKVGDMVEQGEVIGLSGQTGYAYGPHLHLSVVINGVSIDPVKFFELLQ